MAVEDTLARLEALCEYATEGEWEGRASKKHGWELWQGEKWVGDMWTGADCKFVTAARVNMPALLAVARAAQAAWQVYGESWLANGKWVVDELDALGEALAALGQPDEGGEGQG